MALSPMAAADGPMVQQDQPRKEAPDRQEVAAPWWLPLESTLEVVRDTLARLFGDEKPGKPDDDGEQGASIDPNGSRHSRN